jgi:GDP-4-dehydro-6-deoxy-D-mannose reductase
MRALVTGASGFVGRWLTASLREAGWRVTTLDRKAPADLVGDLRAVPLRGVSVDVAFHLAGFSNPAASLDAAGDAYAANAAATARLVRDLRAGRFVIASTAQVYPAGTRPAREDSPLRPASPYAASKLCGEALALASGRDVVVLRPFNHTGPGQSDAYVCPRLARQVARAEAGLGPPRIFAHTLAPRRDFFDVRDMAAAYRAAAERGRRGEIYNVATGSPVTIGRIVELFRRLSRVPLEVHSGKGEADVRTGDASKLGAHTGWRPRIPLRRTLADLLEHERAATA